MQLFLSITALRSIIYCTTLFVSLVVCLPNTAGAAEAYRLGPGDLLAVIVHGVIGEFGRAPIHFPKDDNDDSQPAMGYPYPVLADGKLHLPKIDGVDVTNLTVAEAQAALSAAYLDAQIVSRPHMVALTLMRKRRVNVIVVHNNPSRGRQSAEKVQLSADQATLLHAVSTAGPYDLQASVRVLNHGKQTGQTTRALGDGAIVELRSPNRQVFYTGGLVAGGEYALPVDQQLTALQAIALAGGYRQQGLIPPHQLTIVSRNGPAISLPLATVLASPANFIVRPGDTLIVR